MRPAAGLQQLLLLLVALAAITVCSTTVKICENGQVWARGKELLASMKGQLVLVAFPSTIDLGLLRHLSSLVDSSPSVRFVVLLPSTACTEEEMGRLREQWKRIVIDRDDASSRVRIGAASGEAVLFDRCGRLAKSLPLSSMDQFSSVLRSAEHHAACGWCQYNTEQEGAEKRIDALFRNAAATQAPDRSRAYPRHEQQARQGQVAAQQQGLHRAQPQHHSNHPQHQQRPQQQHLQQQQQRQLSPQQEAAYQEQLRQYYLQNPGAQHQRQQITPTYRNSQQEYHSVQLGQTAGQPSAQTIQRSEYAQRGVNLPVKTANAPAAAQHQLEDYDYGETEKPVEPTIDLRKPAFNEDAQWATAAPFHRGRQHKDLFARPPSTTVGYSHDLARNNAVKENKKGQDVITTIAESQTAKGVAVFEEYSDYEDYGAMKTSIDGKEVEGEKSTQSRPRSVSSRPPSPPPSNYYQHDEDEVPCKAITDDICYHQKKSGRKLSSCCKKGIYIADFCVPGKCSNTTIQACCMQKYLQAKYQCCEDAEMDGTTATDAFSRCCHAHFSAEDDCCPSTSAAEYWNSVNEICLPNVHADLSTVKFEIRLTDGIRVLDLSETDKWQHECRYGTRRAQYVYSP